MTILNDEDEEELEEGQDKFNDNGFLSIGNDYFSKRAVVSANDHCEENSEPYDLRYHHTFASLPAEESHFNTSTNRAKVIIQSFLSLIVNILNCFYDIYIILVIKGHSN